MTSPIQVFKAKTIRTMNTNRPVATHVAIREGRILAVGSEEDVRAWGDVEIDERFADKVLMPGFVEAHAHAMEGSIWRDIYLGYFERTAPDGSKAGGFKTIDAIISHLKGIDAKMDDPEKPLVAWGLDPIYMDNVRLTLEHLDQISATRPVVIIHASLHMMNVNSAVLKMADVTRDTPVEGIIKGPDGEPTGELKEFAAMFLINKYVPAADSLKDVDAQGYRGYARSALVAGITTATDLASHLTEARAKLLQQITEEEDFCLRLKPAFAGMQFGLEEGLALAHEMRKYGNEKYYPNLVKLILDGSIQGYSARLKWPGYFSGAENGQWILPPEQARKFIKAYHAAGFHIHTHVNGDQASEFALECYTEALAENPRFDHRHTLQHCQMADKAQFEQMKALGMCVNIFSNHIYYWGDQHRELTMGPDRAERMDACRTALDTGVNLAIHCDAPVTPMGPLFTAWCAVNRITATGKVLGAKERITREEALHAITLGAAYQLHMDHLVGSIEIAKFADFTVLEQDPFEVDVMQLKDVPVWGTIVGGKVFESPKAA